MFKKRYEIQIAHPGDFKNKALVTWARFYSAPVFRNIEKARQRRDELNQWEWDFAADKPIFRIVDNQTGRVVE